MANIQQRGERSWLLTVSTGLGTNKKYQRFTRTIRIEDEALLKTTKKLQTYLDNEYAKFKQEIEAGEYIAPQKMTFGAFVEEWKTKYAEKHLALKTRLLYYSNLEKRITPVFTHMRMDQVKTMHILDFFDKLNPDHELSSSTVATYHRVLKNIFTRAVEWGVIKNNPVSAYKLPTPKYKSNTPYSEDEVRLLFDSLEGEPYHWRVFTILAIATGLRRGELLGLEWKHVDIEAGVIDVQQSLTVTIDGVATLQEPKTEKSKRKVALAPSVMNELKSYRLNCNKERLKMGDLWIDPEHHFVFAHVDGTPYYQERPYQWFRNFLTRKGLRYIRLHDLRHTSATLLINQGVHPKLISARLGHSNIKTTMDTYGHALQSADRVAADKLEGLFTTSNKAL